MVQLKERHELIVDGLATDDGKGPISNPNCQLQGAYCHLAVAENRVLFVNGTEKHQHHKATPAAGLSEQQQSTTTSISSTETRQACRLNGWTDGRINELHSRCLGLR